ncbi:MAG: hypothetical protein IKA48_01160 [Fibrobacter sp.]|nr:hypothetical protein [Fibrobacter sp.]
MRRRNISKTSCRAIARQFKTRTEFARGDYHAYKVALKNGWLDDYTWFTKQPGHDRDACFNLAKDCKSRSEYAKKHPGAYLHALKNNWISDYTWFAIPKPKCITYDMCNSMAMSCKTQKEFREKYPSAYQKAVSNGWFRKFTWLTLTRGPKLTYDVCLKYAKKCKSMEEFWKTYKTAAAKAAQMKWSNDWTWLVRQHETKLTRAKCYELAKDCHTLKELKIAHPGVLSRAKKEGWVIDYTWLVSGRIKHTYKICWETAKKYKTKADFRKNDRNIYDAAYKNGWLPDYTWLKRAAIIEKRTTDNVYAYEFKGQHAVYVGRTVNLTERDQSHHRDKSTVSRFAKRNKIAIPRMKILVRGVTITEGLAKEDMWVQRYKSKGWTILNIAKTGVASGSLGTLGRVRLTKIHCEAEARKYTTLREFSTNAPHEYQKACRTGWIEQYSWLARERLPHNTWTKDACLLEAKKYNTIKQFRAVSPVAYTTACANKWIDSYTWLSRLKTPNGTWSKASFHKIADAAKNYVSRSDFLTHAKAAYRRAKETGWIDILFPLDAKVSSLASSQTSTV